MTSPSLTSSGAGRSRSPRASKSTTPPPPPPPSYPAAIWPSGPKATLLTSPSLTSSGAGRSRSPRASKSTTPPPPPTPISRGDLALRPEGHARDLALLDLQRRGSEPLAPGVEEHHAAAVRATPYPAAIWPSGPKATLLTSPSLTSSGAGRSRSPRASKSTTPPPPRRRHIRRRSGPRARRPRS